MKKIGNHFTKITNIALVEYNDKTYMREENIINGKVNLRWELKRKNKHNTWDTIAYISDKETLNILNEEYTKMCCPENFSS